MPGSPGTSPTAVHIANAHTANARAGSAHAGGGHQPSPAADSSDSSFGANRHFDDVGLEEGAEERHAPGVVARPSVAVSDLMAAVGRHPNYTTSPAYVTLVAASLTGPPRGITM
jgi:hypothetical protein